MEHEALTPPPSGRLIAPVWTQWPLSPRITKDVGSYADNSKQDEKDGPVGGSKINELASASTEPDNPISKEQRRLRQLRLLSPVRTQQKHESLRGSRHPESCTWLFNTQQYNEWMSLEGSAVLCCYGPPGCGKSVLTSSVTDALISSESEDFEVASYYCDYADKISLEPAFILGALAQSLLQAYGIPDEVADLITLHYRDGERTPEANDVFQVLYQTVCWFQSVILVVDGIDEVDEADKNTILSYLKTLVSCPGLSVKVFVTSREDTDVLPVLTPLPEACFRVNVPEATSKGIYCYVRDTVESLSYAGRLAIKPGNMKLKNEVIQTLRTGARGIFLWVKLQLGTLCLVGHEEGIKAILQDLPKDLDETYARLLQRLSWSKSQVLIRRMFECILAARRPLTMDELCEGMAFTFEDRCWDAEKIPMNNLDVISTYGGLVICDEKTRAIQFAHYTVQQYLLDDRVYQLNMADANAHLGEVCIAYLWFDDFNTQVAPNGSMKATETMISPVSPLKSPLDPTQHSMDISSITIGFRQSIIQPSFEKFKLLRYARRNWLWHAARFTQSEKPTRRDILLRILATQKQLPFEFKPWPADIFLGNPYPDLVGWAIVNNNPTLIKSLAGFDPMFDFKEYIRDSASWVFKGVTDNNISSEQQASIAYTQDTWNENFPMHGWMYSRMLIACRKGNMAILDLCRPDLDNRELPWLQFRGHLILEAASTNQHAIIESFNLGQGRTNDQCRSFATAYAGQLCNALERAALGGHIDMVQKLGRAGWSASNIFGSDPSMGMCALHNAIMGNNSDVVEALLAALEITIYDPSQPMSQDDSRIGIKTSAFCKAASSGNVAVVKIFLADGASPVATGDNGMCPYMQAIKDGQMNIFELMFPLDGCGGAENSTGLPLSMAAANGQAEIVDFLILKGANVFPNNALDSRLPGLKQGSNTSWPTPLYAASANGHYAIVQKLLSAGAGADVMSARDLPSDASGSVHSQGLYYPDQEPSSGTIQDYQRPLGGAALNGHFRVVQLLLKAQALVNPTDLSENSPLLLALVGGHAEVANLLSSKGAEIQNKESAEQALLSCSMGQGGTNALGLLIEYGVSSDCNNFMGESCLHIATTAGLTDIMKELIEAGADINIRDHAGQTPLMRACSGQKFRAAWILVNLGANLSAKDNAGNSALSYASVGGSPQIVQLLLTNGAPVNSSNLVRQTPLLEACLAGDQAVVKILLSHGASTHARTGQSILHKTKRIPRGYTPLMIATIMNESGVIETLCAKSKKGVEDIEFEQRRTSLLLAAEKGNLSTFHALVKGGASLKAKSSAGLSVLNFAIKGRNVEVLKYLVAIHKRELKTKSGLFSPEEISAAIANGDALPGDVLLKLQKLGVRDEGSDDCIPIVDPLEELYAW